MTSPYGYDHRADRADHRDVDALTCTGLCNLLLRHGFLRQHRPRRYAARARQHRPA